MKALMKTAAGVGQIELTDIPVPRPAGGEVLVKVHRAAVCGTDIHIEHDRFANSPPMVLGHEFSGVIAEVGPEVRGVQVGTRVVAANNPFACGKCSVCGAGHPNLCSEKRAMGIHSDGCFAEYVKLPAHLMHEIPASVSLEQAALMEPLAVATHAVAQRCGISRYDRAVVFGAGAIGLLAAQVARAEGADEVLVVGTDKDELSRLRCARALGFETVNVDRENLRDRVMGLSQGQGATVVVEASGSAAAIGNGIELLAKTGRMAISGITGRSDIAVNWDGLTAKGATLYFCYSSVDADWRKGLQYLAAGKVLTEPLITHRFGLNQWREAFDTLARLAAIRPVFQIAE